MNLGEPVIQYLDSIDMVDIPPNPPSHPQDLRDLHLFPHWDPRNTGTKRKHWTPLHSTTVHFTTLYQTLFSPAPNLP